MKQFLKIFKFELKSYLSNKVFVGVTLFLVVAIALVMFAPRIISSFESGETEETPSGEKPVMLILSEENAEAVAAVFAASGLAGILMTLGAVSLIAGRSFQ